VNVLAAGDSAIGNRRGTGEARFEELYRAHGREALRLAYLLTGNKALGEDLAHEAFARVLGRFGDLRNPDGFRTYLLRSVVNLSYSHFRKMKNERAYLESQKNAPEQRTQDPSKNLVERDAMRVALQSIPERQRVALVLRYCEDLSEAETAEIMRTSTKAVKSLVTRGLANMRTQAPKGRD
jgi:RNA polymerase sigma-70 factor (sigma-E family)